MATLYLTGFEYGITPTNAGLGLATGVSNVAIDSTIKHTGNYSLRCQTSANTSYIYWNITNSTVVIGRVYFYFDTLPNTSLNILYFITNNTTYANFRYNSTSEILQCSYTGATTIDGPAVTTGSWYCLDFQIDVSGTTHSIDWQVNESAQTQVSISGRTRTSVYRCVLGLQQTNSTADMYYDDLVLLDGNGSYPIGPGGTVGLVPNSDGTHNAGTDVIENQDGTDIGVVSAYPLLDEIPMTIGSGYYVRQAENGTGNYAEVNFDDTTISDANIIGMMSVLGYYSGGTLTNHGKAVVSYDGFTYHNDVIIDGDMSVTTAAFASKAITNTSWTQSEANAMQARVGYSSDASPYPYWFSLLLELAYTAANGEVTAVSATTTAEFLAPSFGAVINANISAVSMNTTSAMISPSYGADANVILSTSGIGDVIFSSDFETGDLEDYYGPVPPDNTDASYFGKPTASDWEITVESDPVKSGYAAKIVTETGTDVAGYLFPYTVVDGDILHSWASYLVPSGTPIPPWWWNVLQVKCISATYPKPIITINIIESSSQLRAVLTLCPGGVNPATNYTQDTPIIISRDTWVTFHVEVYYHATEGYVKIYQDDTLIFDISGFNTKPGGLKSYCSYQSYGDPSDTTTLWVDDIIQAENSDAVDVIMEASTGMLAPTISVGTNANVTAVAMSTTAAGIAPAVSGIRNAQIIPVAMTATTQGLSPVITGTENASINAVSMAGDAVMVSPEISAQIYANVTAESMDATAAGIAPAVAGIRNAQIIPVAMTAEAAMAIPIISTQEIANITAVIMTASAKSLTPVITGIENANITADMMLSDAALISPSISAVQTASIQAVVMTANAAMGNPIITTEGSVNVNAESMMTAADMLLPEIVGIGNANITAVIMTVTAESLSPAVSSGTNAIIGSETMLAATSFIAPMVSGIENIAVSVTSPISCAASLLTPVIAGVWNAHIAASEATGGASMMAPSIIGGTDVNVICDTASITAEFLTPNISAIQNCNTIAVSMIAISSMNIPLISEEANVSVLASIMSATADMLLPLVTPVYKGTVSISHRMAYNLTIRHAPLYSATISSSQVNTVEVSHE